MKTLSIFCFLILIATATFAAENVAKGEPLSGTLLVNTEVLKQGLEGRTSLPIFLNKDLRVIVPRTSLSSTD
jgi:hypothetical protein